jgi:hypothetical protein
MLRYYKMPFNIFSRSNDSKNINETNFQNQATDLSLKRKKNVTCPTDEKYRASIDYEFNTLEECERAKREVAEELAQLNKPYVRRDLAKENFDRRQMIVDSTNAFNKAERRRAALGNFDVIYPNEKVGAVVTIQGKQYTLDSTLRPIVEGGRKSRSRKTKTKRSKKSKKSKKNKSKKSRK